MKKFKPKVNDKADDDNEEELTPMPTDKIPGRKNAESDDSLQIKRAALAAKMLKKMRKI